MSPKEIQRLMLEMSTSPPSKSLIVLAQSMDQGLLDEDMQKINQEICHNQIEVLLDISFDTKATMIVDKICSLLGPISLESARLIRSHIYLSHLEDHVIHALKEHKKTIEMSIYSKILECIRRDDLARLQEIDVSLIDSGRKFLLKNQVYGKYTIRSAAMYEYLDDVLELPFFLHDYVNIMKDSPAVSKHLAKKLYDTDAHYCMINCHNFLVEYLKIKKVTIGLDDLNAILLFSFKPDYNSINAFFGLNYGTIEFNKNIDPVFMSIDPMNLSIYQELMIKNYYWTEDIGRILANRPNLIWGPYVFCPTVDERHDKHVQGIFLKMSRLFEKKLSDIRIILSS